ncbi:hypothetical protein [Sphingomonas sp. UYP23]
MSSGATPALLPLREVLASWDRVVIRWDLQEHECSLLLGVRFEGAIDDVDAYRFPDVERRMRLLVELAPVLATVLFSQERVRTWLRLENANLSGRTPIETMGESPQWIRWLVDSLGVVS